MEFKIASDARPQFRSLAWATAASVALWILSLVPFAGYVATILSYPFRLFVTFIHEGGHALAALLTGNSVLSLSVAPDGSGLTYSVTGGLFSQIFVSSAGYIGSMAFGVVLLFLIRRRVKAHFVLAACAGLVLFLTLTFGLFKPLVSAPWSALVSIPFTLVAGILIAAGLIALAKFSGPGLARFAVSFLAVQCVLNALLDLKTLFWLSAPWSTESMTDAANMAQATGVPAIFWTFIWIGVALALLSLALRFYAVTKHAHKSTQQDLPFTETTTM